MDDFDRIIIEARRIGLSITELNEMSPKEFKAANKGYQLHLSDQRQQILYGHRIPQMTVSGAEANQDSLDEAFQKLSDRDKAQMEKLIDGDKPKEERLTVGNQKFIEAMQRIGKGWHKWVMQLLKNGGSGSLLTK